MASDLENRSLDIEAVPSNRHLDRCPVIFLLGAGASVPLGMPTTLSLRKSLADDTPDGRIVEELYESAAYRFRISSDSINIEDVLEHLYELQLLLWLARHSSLPTVLPRLSGNSRRLESAAEKLERVQHRVYEELHRTCGDCSGQDVHSLWRRVLRFVSSRQPAVPVFTLNYDWSFERLCIEEMKRYHLVDGFELLGGTWDVTRFAQMVPMPSKITIALFKLHGSTNWLPDGPTKSMGQFPLDQADSEDGLPPQRFALIYPGHAHEMWFGKEGWARVSGRDGMFVPWDEQEPYRTLHAYLHQALRRARLIVVIGYAFHDERVTGAILEALKANSGLKVLVVDPGIRRQVRRPRSAYLEPPFDYLKFSNSDTDWSRFYWLAGRFGDGDITSKLIQAMRRAFTSATHGGRHRTGRRRSATRRHR